MGEMMHNNTDNLVILRQAIDASIESLGGPIHKTITWYMNSKGVFSDPRKIDLDFFYSNLKELVGPGADLIIEETWQHLQKRGLAGQKFEPRSSPLEKIQKIMKMEEDV
jgi:hypothetical protein